jgi:hypothetical protein
MIPELEEIKRILLNEWDPIGLADVPEAVDEYDAYALRVFTLLQSGAKRASIRDYLQWVVTERMGLSGNLEHSEQIANGLLEIHESRAQL